MNAKGDPGEHPEHQRLNEQLKRLVRSERARHLSQRALEDQLRRVRLLNEFALAASTAQSVAEIFRLGLELLMALFPFEQGLAWEAREGRLHPIATHALPGRQERSAERLGATMLQSADLGPTLRGPTLLAAGEAPEAGSRAGGLVAALAALFESDDGAPAAQDEVVLILPLWQRPSALAGVLVLRRHGRLTPADRPLPTAEDRDFLEVLGKQFAVAAANAELVDHLRRNYTQLFMAQEDLVQKERLAAVGELAAQIAHEVRNPLGAILNSVSALRRLVNPQADAGQLVAVVAEESQRLERMVEDLLDFARPSAPRCQPEDLEVIVRSALEGASRTVDLSAVEVKVEAAEALPPLPVDARMIRQAVLNLMINAAQAMSGKGRLSVRIGLDAEGASTTARVDVSDTGPGVPQEVASRLFDPFVTTKASGTGLGLAVVRRLVEAHHGRASFQSAPGRGSTFSLHLPLPAAAPGPAPRQTP